MPKERDIFKMIWTNFRNSIRPRKLKGDLIGKDVFGNKYFELPPNPSIGKRKASRWFEPVSNSLDEFDKEMPAEWEAWLRGRRDNPPTEYEVMKSSALAAVKKERAAEIHKEFHPNEPLKTELPDKINEFPQYPDYELEPGKQKK